MPRLPLRPVILLVCAALALSACAKVAGSRLNPMNWFGHGAAVVAPTAAEVPLVPADRVQTIDSRVPVEQVLSAALDRTPNGAILRATGQAAGLGYYNAQLVAVDSPSGTLTFELRAEAPTGATAGGAAAARQITVATSLSSADLAGISRIVVQGTRNSVTLRR
ncbi:MAG: hypothetical protein GC146_06695 [Limimaricola sp.]|uniref:hypothetical protein n=1 Tax=Limimaricola sp. TaxID=2211665 RepID=UPI001DC3626B|nr:hypothetical protein [Limimaricola sp.]MBI1416894.1 hypothetical protein [Limimaricola sp.]